MFNHILTTIEKRKEIFERLTVILVDDYTNIIAEIDLIESIKVKNGVNKEDMVGKISGGIYVAKVSD
jgi:hypothetical protein